MIISDNKFPLNAEDIGKLAQLFLTPAIKHNTTHKPNAWPIMVTIISPKPPSKLMPEKNMNINNVDAKIGTKYFAWL